MFIQQVCDSTTVTWDRSSGILRENSCELPFSFITLLQYSASICLCSCFFFLELFSLLRCLFPLFISSPLVFLSPGGVCIRAGLRVRTVPILHVNKKGGWKHSGSCSGTFLLTVLCYYHRRQFFCGGGLWIFDLKHVCL